MPSEAKEARIIDAIITALDSIGPVGATWLTNPNTPVIGAPDDAIADLARPRLYVQHLDTGLPPVETTGMQIHSERATFAIVIAANTHRETLNVKRDCVAAIRAAEGTFASAFSGHLRVDRFSHSDQLTASGTWLGVITAHIDYDSSHTDL